MKTLRIEAKFKGKLVGFDDNYKEPEDLEEAIETDGESKIMRLYLEKRKTNALDKIRLAYKSKLDKVGTGLLGFIQGLDEEEAREKLETFGIPTAQIDGIMKELFE